jgi:hypothetical protein
MESQALIGKCETVLNDIEEMREHYQKEHVKWHVKYKNSGFKGWLRKLVGKQYDENKALAEFENDYNCSYNRISWRYFSDEKHVARSLIELAKESAEVFVSRKDFEMLNDIMHSAACIRRVNERREAL